MITAFEKAYKLLNPAQKQAVDAIEGPVMVLAGPGTGKTQILTLRIANILLQTQVNPGNILALTFTDSGVAAMRKRLMEIIGPDSYKVAIHTFHSFCNEIITSQMEYFPKLLNALSIAEIEQLQVIEQILDQNEFEKVKPFGDKYYYAKPLLQAIEELKKDNVSAEDLKLALLQQQKDLLAEADLYHDKGAYKGTMKGKYLDLQKDILKNLELVRIFTLYQQELEQRRLYDFSDMVLEVVKALKDYPDLLMGLQETYQYLLVDEHQDSNASQNQLIELLVSYDQNPNLFVVGDDKQAIYRFQGASLENFLYFQKLFPTAKLISLEENYRSSQTILDAASSLIRKNLSAGILIKNLDLKAVTNQEKQKIRIVELSNYDSEHYFIVSDILQKHQEGINFASVAVLARNNRDLLPLTRVFDQKGVPYVIESDQDIFADPNIQKLIILFKAIANLGQDSYLAPSLLLDFLLLDPLDVYRVMRFAKNQSLEIYQLLSDKGYLKQSQVKNIGRFIKLINQIKAWKKLSDNDTADNVFIKVFKQSGLLDYLLKEQERKYDILDKFARVYTQIKSLMEKDPGFKLAGFLKYIDLLQEHQLSVKKTARFRLKDSARLMTVHKSKGLEFDYVYLINVFDSHWGNNKGRVSNFKLPREYLGLKLKIAANLDELEDERRLFYVALTRAKNSVTITFSNHSLDGKEQFVSQFVQEVDDAHKLQVDANEFEAGFAKTQEQLFDLQKSVLLDKDDYFTKQGEMFKSLFLEQGISATGLNDYLKCAWRYIYRHLLGFPEGTSSQMIFGTAIHRTLNQYIHRLNQGEGDLSLLLEYFRAQLQKLVLPIQYQQLWKKGEKALTVFYENEAKFWKKGLVSEYALKHVPLSSGITLNGVIDMLEPKGKNLFTVYDFKTGEAKSRNVILGATKNSTGDYFRQLVFYALILQKFNSFKMRAESGVISFIEPDEKGHYHKEEFEITSADLKNLEAQIKQVSSEIINLSFWGKSCDDRDCQYCRMQGIMRPGIERRK